MNGSTTPPICPCDTTTNPLVVFNPPGLTAIAYRWGDYDSFRFALLQALPGETELSQIVAGRLEQIWRPAAEGDLALQMVEWWAYLADILTFYCERIGAQSYLRTADLAESTNRLIQLLGYRPRPALGARGQVAALLTGAKPVTLPQGLQIQSKPGPGQQPQIFELYAATTIAAPDRVTATATPPAAPLVSGGTASLIFAGTVGGLKAGDEVLLIAKGWAGTDGNWGVGAVHQVAKQSDPAGAANTSVTVAVTSPGTGLAAATATGYRALKSGGTAPLYPFANASANGQVMGGGQKGANGYTGFVVLASVNRQIAVGDTIVIEDPRPGATNPPLAASVTAYSETVYYANNPSDPGTQPTPPPAGTTIPIAVPVSRITFATQNQLSGDPTNLVVRYGWKDLGTLIDLPLATVGGAAAQAEVKLQLALSGGFSPKPGTPVLIEDAQGDGIAGSIDDPGSVAISAPIPALAAPLAALFNLLSVSRGKSVPSEVLGSGDAAILGQDFTLQNAPVTYLQDPASISGDDYSSTVKVWVNGIQWEEVRSFYDQPGAARVFLTREDEKGKTHVVFNGRLPTGSGNVVASYRYGAGAQAPAPGTLSVVLQPQPGLKSIVNPIAPSGGADADPPDKISKLAPLSVMAFNRAVSLDDYRVIAASAPGVGRASAAYEFDPGAQRPVVTVWVGDDAGAVAAAQSALAAAADPNRLPIVKLATQVAMVLSLTYLRDPLYQDATVLAGLNSALLDPDRGLFGINAIAIGEAVYDSQIYAACLAVPGVKAIHDLSFAAPPQFAIRRLVLGTIGGRLPIRFPRPLPPRPRPVCTGERHDPGPGGYFAVAAADLHLAGAAAP